jgi:hypothetical protein
MDCRIHTLGEKLPVGAISATSAKSEGIQLQKWRSNDLNIDLVTATIIFVLLYPIANLFWPWLQILLEPLRVHPRPYTNTIIKMI